MGTTVRALTTAACPWIKVPVIVLAFVLLLAGCAQVRNPSRQERYRITFPDLSLATGQRFTNATHVSADFRMSRIREDLNEQTNASVAIDFNAEWLVVGANTNSRSAAINFNVGRLESVVGGVTNLLLSGGDTVRAKVILGEAFFTRDRGSLPLATQRALAQVFQPMSDGEWITDPRGRNFGLDRLRAIGESWTVQDQKAKKELLQRMRWLSEDLSPDDLALRLQFMGITNAFGNEAFCLRFDLSIKSTKLPLKFRLPPHFAWSEQHASIHATVDFVLPLRGVTKSSCWQWLGEMNLSGVEKRPGGDVTMDAHIRMAGCHYVQLLQNTGGRTE